MRVGVDRRTNTILRERGLPYFNLYCVCEVMRSSLSRWTLLLGCLLLALSANAQPSTKITFFVEHEVELEKDYLEMVLNIKAQDTSLKEALTSAADTVAQVRTLAEDYCKTHSRKAGECQEITESGKFNVEPLYRLIRKEPVFIGTCGVS